MLAQLIERDDALEFAHELHIHDEPARCIGLRFGVVMMMLGVEGRLVGVAILHHGNDADSREDAPRWFVVDVKLVRKFGRIITLDELRQHAAKTLKDFVLLRRGNRLSVMPVTKKDWDFVLALE